MREISFSPEVALASVLYVLRQKGGAATVHDLLKACYFADKEHLSRFGWLGIGDRYCAMTFGPVPSTTYDLLKAAGAKRNSAPPRFVSLARSQLDGRAYPTIRARQEPDMSLLSPALVQCLDAAIKKTSKWSFIKRTNESHDAAWVRARARWAEDGNMDMPVESIATTLPNSQEILEHIAG